MGAEDTVSIDLTKSEVDILFEFYTEMFYPNDWTDSGELSVGWKEQLRQKLMKAKCEV